jgi:hypothetical protein
MDTTIQTALNIISKLPDGSWRKIYWINFVENEVYALRSVKLGKKADLLENSLHVAIASSQIQ